MVCIKFLAVTLGLALGAQAADNALEATVVSDQGALWEYAWPKMQAQVPGIECSLSSITWNTTAKRHESCEIVESKLLAIFPGIHCTGQLDEDAILTNLGAPVTSVQRRETALQRRRVPLDDAIDRDIKAKDDQINQQRRNFLQGCANAPHPANCYACVGTAAAQAIGNGSKCVVAAHIALKVLNANQGDTFKAYAACVAGIVGDMAHSAGGCPLR